MEHLDTRAVRSLPLVDGPLRCLGDAFASRFHSWHGASSRRYVMSVFPVDAVDADPQVPDPQVPDFEACVLVAVATRGEARRVLGIYAVERGSDRRLAAQVAGRGRVDEWHVHLLAGDRRERAEVVADLAARYRGDERALSA